MDIVIDTSALIAVIVGEPERHKIIEITSGNTGKVIITGLNILTESTGLTG